MELGTFGAVLGFASEVVAQSAEFFANACGRAQRAELAQALKTLRDAANKERATLEQTRRENVTEMILEPIQGLRREDYESVGGPSVPGPDAELLAAALRLEERDHRFFRDASANLPYPEVARLFRKIAKRKEENLAMLRALGA